MVPSPGRTPPPPPLVELSGATKLFGSTVAIWRVDLQIGRGEGVGIVGGNGSGKTTLLRAVAGVLELDAGRRTVLGGASTGPRTALLGHQTGLFEDLTVSENVRLFARGRRAGSIRRDDLLARLGLGGLSDARVSSLSAGTRRRAGLARALAADPDLLVLDEPFASVDADYASAMAAVLRDWLADGGSLLLAAHDAAALAPLCDRLHWLTGARLVSSAQDLEGAGRRSA
ncbi:MAG: ABC transporter ATP-binding protein [Candidatus Limnocylindrales bacterium]